MATKQQLKTIEARAYNDTAREMEREGVTLTYRQADALGAAALDWLARRLNLNVTENDSGVDCAPTNASGASHD